jgi:hypothetical protein
MILGFTGVAASLLMLARIRRTTEIERSTAPGAPADPGSPTAASRSPVVETITLPASYSAFGLPLVSVQ